MMESVQRQLVFVLIPVHNRKTITLACLKNLEQNGDLDRYQVVVIDDGSTDGTHAAVRSLYPQVTVLQGDGNLWWTGAIAMGMKYAYQQGAEYLIWLNDDCQLAPATLSDLVEFCRTCPDAIVGGQGLEDQATQAIAFGGKRKTWQGYRFIKAACGQVVECDLLSGNLVCIPRQVIEKVGYPNPDETPHYGGDSLYLIRAKKTGFLLFVDARNSIKNLPGKPKLYPDQWLLDAGEPLKILKLVFVPQSGLSWRVWLRLNWEAYSVWGLVMFWKKYLSILLITGFRFLPMTFRKRIFASKIEA